MTKTKLLVFIALVLAFMPFFSSAQTVSGETPFGGMHIVTLDESVCTCSGNSNWILDYKTNSLLMLYYQAGQSVLYTNYNTRATYQLGTYSMGGQPCSILIGYYCYDLTNQGTYGSMPGTGTSITRANTNSLFTEYIPSANQRSYIASLKNTFRSLSI